MQDITIIDSHCDTACELLNRGEHLYVNTGHLSLKQMELFQSYIQFYAAWVGKEEKYPTQRAVDILSCIKREIATNSDLIEEIKNFKELTSVIERKKHGAILALEDARSLEGNIETLYKFYHMGVRAIALAWNDNNEVTDGILSERDAGLTPFGEKVVQEMHNLHMIVDVSHITEKGFWDICALSDRPFMASHSNCLSICKHRRNLNDEQIKEMIKRKGFMGINLYPKFLSDDGIADISTVLDHMDHVLSLGGTDILGLGSDFDGVDYLAEGISDAKDYINLIDAMEQHGYSGSLIDKITHKNMINFMERIEK